MRPSRGVPPPTRAELAMVTYISKVIRVQQICLQRLM